jgi:nitrogen fixation protein NifU and related proteins
MDMYRENLIEHYNNPRNFGELKKSDSSAEIENISCGDLIKMQVNVKDGVIKDVMFTGEGCAISIASASMLTEYIKGKPVDFAEKFTFKDLETLLGVELSPSRIKCANLGLEALESALKSLTKKAN